ncbi:uncharacterized protein EDB91DRAFT_1061490 [Suillus paluster]|uniref:uncharacterized protein n=1 Tax=Suillus paluster TaxID=48578 RepID=UPI001B86C0F9|nr:uncharacterized protein EDB91DRAFT_1061490 [Suillus paluster]KAG1726726.1 hypothetical protein EDB91DRAFT_1061490 [Suillus paluster]
MPLTNDEIAAITGDIAATNLPVIPELPTHPSLPDPPPCTPSPHPFECSSHDHDPPSPTCAGPLREANSSSWAARNPTRPVLHPRTPPPQLTDAQKASQKIKRDQKHEAAKRLHDGVTKYLNEQRMKIEALARTHNITSKHINDIIGSQTNYHKSRKPQLINALVHAKAKEMNTAAAYIKALNEHRDQKGLSVRANNLAAARDVVATTDRIVKELDDLRVWTGVYGTLFVVRSHINNTIQSTMHGTDNSEDFWDDVYEHPMADFLRQYEQWACTQNQSNLCTYATSRRSQCTRLFGSRKEAIEVTSKKDIMMNYNNYETSVIETYGVRLVGWPHGVKFTSPSNIGTVGDIRKLQDALKARTCYWAVLSPAEVKAHASELDTRRSAGEVVRKP